MRSLIIFSLLSLFLSGDAFGREELLLARVTGYWRAEGCGRIAAWNGEHLRSGHCAVDPRKIPYGSKVIFPDAECIAVDTGPAVVNRASARFCGRTAAEKSALVIDRFFETRQEAVAWSNAHPQFITVRIVSPDRHPRMATSTLASKTQLATKSITLAELANPDGDKLPPPRNKFASAGGDVTPSQLNRIGR